MVFPTVTTVTQERVSVQRKKERRYKTVKRVKRSFCLKMSISSSTIPRNMVLEPSVHIVQIISHKYVNKPFLIFILFVCT